MKLWKRIAAALLAVCMTLPFAACSGDTSWVYDYDDIQITSGMYIAFTMSAYSQVSQQDDYDSEKSILDQTIEDKYQRALLQRSGSVSAQALWPTNMSPHSASSTSWGFLSTRMTKRTLTAPLKPIGKITVRCMRKTASARRLTVN